MSIFSFQIPSQLKTFKALYSAIVFSFALAVMLKLIGLTKEMVLAYHFGVGKILDFYVFSLLCILFFVNPIAGNIGLILTEKFIANTKFGLIYSSAIYLKMLVITFVLFLAVLSSYLIIGFAYVYVNNLQDVLLLESWQLILFSFSMVFSALAVVNGAVFTAQKKFITFNALPAITPSIIILFVIFDILNNGLFSLFAGTFIGFGVEMCLGFLLLSNLISRPKQNFKKVLAKVEAIKIKEFSSLFFASMIMSGCIVTDQFMATLAGEGAVSMINFGTRLAFGLVSVISVLWLVLYPKFTELIVNKMFESTKKLYTSSVLTVFLLSIPFCIFLSFFSTDIARILFGGGAFTSADVNMVAYLQSVYVFYIPLYAVCLISMRLSNSFRNYHYVLLGNSITLVCNISINFVFIKWFGVAGIAYATIVAYSISATFWFVAMIFLLHQQKRIQN